MLKQRDGIVQIAVRDSSSARALKMPLTNLKMAVDLGFLPFALSRLKIDLQMALKIRRSAIFRYSAFSPPTGVRPPLDISGRPRAVGLLSGIPPEVTRPIGAI
jgi:hypothetical protein